MKTFYILLLLSMSCISQVSVKATNALYPKGNIWADSVTVRESSTGLPNPGVQTWQVKSTAVADIVYSNYHAVTKADRAFRVFGNVFAVAGIMNTTLDIGYYQGTGGFPDITGIEWVLVATLTTAGTFDLVFTDSVTTKVPQRIYFRFVETGAQQNNYNITLNIKQE